MLRFVSDGERVGQVVAYLFPADVAEATVLDLVSFPQASGALFNVATIIGEMLAEDASMSVVWPRWPPAIRLPSSSERDGSSTTWPSKSMLRRSLPA